MKRLLIYALFLIPLCTPFAQSSSETTVSVVVLKDIKPVSYIDESGNPAGLFSDLISKIGEHNGFRVQFVPSTWAEGMDLVKQGKVDIMPAVVWSEEREQYLDFCKIPVMISWGTLAIHTDSTLNDLHDVNGKKIAIMKGDQNAHNFKTFIKDFTLECEFIEVDKHDEIVPLIEDGSVYGGVLFNTYNIQNDKVEQTSIVFGAVKSYYATKNGNNAALIECINNQLDTWKHDKNSYYYEALNRYLLQRANAASGLPRWLIFVFLITAAVALLLFLWVQTLRIAVKNTTRDLRSSEARLRNIVENMPVMMIAFDDQPMIIAWNNECERITGYSKDEMVNKPEAIQYLFSDEIIRNSFIESINLNGDFYSMHFTVIAKDSSPRIISWSKVSKKYPLPSWHSWVIGVDITELKNYENEQIKLINRLRQSEKMEAIGQLAGGIAHDFNNILGGIIGYADMTIDSMNGDDPNKSYIDKIIKGAERAKNLVAQILSFSRQNREIKSPTDIGKIITEVVDMLRATIPASIKIQTDIDRHLRAVLADATRIHELVMNLSTNAAQAMNEKGELCITCKTQLVESPVEGRIGTIQPGIYTIISIIDNGCGMDAQTMQRIFEPFFTTKEAGKGTGMGLAVVFGIVQSHNGNITVESNVGHGTCFTIYLPAIEQQESPSKTNENLLPTGKESILVIDDETVLIDLLNTMLQSLGYTVTSYIDSNDALNAFKADPKRFDLIITDQTMPGISGLELSKEILKIRDSIPVILCSGFSRQVDEKIALDAGIKAFITKPVRKRELAFKIREILDSVDA